MIPAQWKRANILALSFAARDGDLEETQRLLKNRRIQQREAETVQQSALDAFYKENFACGLLVCRSLRKLQCNDRVWNEIVDLLVQHADRGAVLELLGFLPDSSLTAVVQESALLSNLFMDYPHWQEVIQYILSRLPQLPLVDCGFKTTVVHDPRWMRQDCAAEALGLLLQHMAVSVLASRGSSWCTPLVAALKEGIAEELLLMLLEATPPEGFLATDNNGNIPLVHAAKLASKRVFKKVVKATPQEGFSHVNGSGCNLMTAAIRLQVPLKRLKYMYRWGGEDSSILAVVNGGRDCCPLAAAFRHTNSEVLQWILSEMPAEALVDPIQLQRFERTNILCYAMKRIGRSQSRLDMVIGAVVSHCGQEALRDMLSLKPGSLQQSPLEEALTWNIPRCTRWLLSCMEKYCPEEITQPDDKGATYLHKAVSTQLVRMVEPVLPYFSSTDARTARAQGLGGATASELAQKFLDAGPCKYQKKELKKIFAMLQPAVKKAL